MDSTVWVRRSAIRPVPSYAGVPQHALDTVREGLADDDEEARSQLDEAFERLSARSPPWPATWLKRSVARSTRRRWRSAIF